MDIRSPSLPARALRSQGVKSPVTTFTPSPQTLSPFLRGRKSVQMYLVSREDTGSTFSESHSRMRSWISEAPPLLLRCHSFLEREHQPRDQYWEIPKTWIRPDGLESKDIIGRTRRFHYFTEKIR